MRARLFNRKHKEGGRTRRRRLLAATLIKPRSTELAQTLSNSTTMILTIFWRILNYPSKIRRRT